MHCVVLIMMVTRNYSEEIEIKVHVGVKAILKTAFSLKQGSPDVVIVLKNKQF